MCNFTVLALADIPVAWQQPPARQWLAEVASRLGIESSAVFETVVLEVPQTALGNEYLQWHQTRTRDDFEAGPVMLDSLRDFVSNHGAQGLREFEKSMLYSRPSNSSSGNSHHRSTIGRFAIDLGRCPCQVPCSHIHWQPNDAMFFLQRKGVLTPITSQFLVSKSIETIGDLTYITNTFGRGDIAAQIKLAQAEGLSAIVDTAKGLLTQLCSAASSSIDMPMLAPKKAPRQMRAQAVKLELTQKNDV